jgi:N utilization substance protein B
MTEKQKDAPSSFQVGKSATRLMAVQGIYTHDVTKGTLVDSVAENTDALVEDVIRILKDDELGSQLDMDKIDRGLLHQLIDGVQEHAAVIDESITPYLQEGWSIKRLSSIVRAILRTAVYEMIEWPKTRARTIITEYVNIADAFLEEKETRFVNALLDKVARQLREKEF